MEEEDVEAISARMKGWQAILFGPRFPWLLHTTALKKGSQRIRRWILIELLANVLWLVLVFAVFDSAVLMFHVFAMFVGQNLTAFFAVWTVHHDCDPERTFGRTIRHKIKSKLTYDMLYHVEHHLFPTVPTRRLSILAYRLDQVAPELCAKMVF